jgi:cytosolic carboxypeptidase protein 2/3
MAFANPYTYTDLQNDLGIYENNSRTKNIMTREILCKTISGTNIDLLTITSAQTLPGDLPKKGIIFTARVHPGETVGSWLMKGVIDFLLSDDKEAACLLDNFVFKLVPMLNPDGVIQGNYRCSFAGCDLNRKYTTPSKVLHPEIFFTKKIARKFAKENPLLSYCDFHGHSKK